jgi:predicted acetyltransferase
MTQPVTRLVPATPDQRPLIANLVQLYLYDMTESMPFPIGLDGRFEYGFLDRFWRFPYLIHAGAEIAGFALVVDECPLTSRKGCFFMAEFFVLKAYRGRGVGRGAFKAALKEHPGPWHIATPEANQSALVFWSKCLAPLDPTTTSIFFEGENWLLNAFNAPAA